MTPTWIVWRMHSTGSEDDRDVPAGFEPATFRVGACRRQSDRGALDAVKRGGAAIRSGYGECFVIVVAAGIADRHSS